MSDSLSLSVSDDAYPDFLDAFALHAQRHPLNPALTLQDAEGNERSLSYGELHAHCRQVALRLRSAGLGSGDRIALALTQGLPLITAFLGALLAGAVPAIFPYPTARGDYLPRLQDGLDVIEPAALLCEDIVRPALSGLVGHQNLLILDAGPAMEDGGPPFVAGPRRADDATAYIQFSSGTTGRVKGALISHAALGRQLHAMSVGFPILDDDVFVGWLPLHHDMGLVCQLLLPLAYGRHSVLMPAQAWVRSPLILFHAVQRHAGTFTAMPNFAFDHCVRAIPAESLAGVDLGTLRRVFSGGERIMAETLERFTLAFTPIGLKPKVLSGGYGMAEVVMAVTMTPAGRRARVDRVSRRALFDEHIARPWAGTPEDDAAIVSCGCAPLGAPVAVVDDDGHPLPERHIGDIVVQDWSFFSGYIHDEAASEQMWRQGRLLTGDVGYMADGELYVLDRKKDLLIIAGRNLSPINLEEAARRGAGPTAVRAAAFGLQSALAGTEIPAVAVELRGEPDAAEREALRDRIRERIFAELGLRVEQIFLVERGWVEVTTSGKIARRRNRDKLLREHPQLLAQLAAADAAAAEPVAGSDVETTLRALLQPLMPGCRPETHDNLFELGLDSLGFVELLAGIQQRFGRNIDTEALVLQPTIATLTRLLQTDAPAEALLARRPARQKPGLLAGLRRRLVQGPVIRGRSLPYAWGNALLRMMAPPLRAVATLVNRPDLRNFQQFLQETGYAGDRARATRIFLMGNSWLTWRLHALKSSGAQRRWITVEGEQHLREALSAGRGVVLAWHHTPFKHLLTTLLSQGPVEHTVVGHVNAAVLRSLGYERLAEGYSGSAEERRQVRALMLDRAREVLKRGGIAVILPDDYEGGAGITLECFGRARPVRNGMQELASHTGAPIVPLFGSMDESGHLRLVYEAPLGPSPLHEYGARLARHWLAEPGSLDGYIIRRHLALPRQVGAESGVVTSTA